MHRRRRSRGLAWMMAVGCVLLAGLAPQQSAASAGSGAPHAPSARVAPLDVSSATAPTTTATLPLSGTATAQATLATSTTPAASTTVFAPTASATVPTSATPAATTTPLADPSVSVGPASPTAAPTNTAAPTVLPPTDTVLPTALPSDTPVTATEPPIPAITGGDLLALPLAFEANQGQSASTVQYVAHMGSAATAFFTAQQAVLAPAVPLSGTGGLTQTNSFTTAVVGVQFSTGTPQLSGMNPLTETANYLVGNDPSQWQRGVPTYGGIQYSDVAPGITLSYTGTGGQLESIYQVAPGADPGNITLTISGTTGLDLDGAGNLLLHTTLGDLTLSAPAAYQTINGQQQLVTVQYSLLGSDTVGFSVGSYDSSQPLTIDPVLAYAPLVLGGSADDEARAVALDVQGNIYVTGNTASSDFPTWNPLYGYQGNDDAFITKLSPDGQHVLYSTYLGGNDPNNVYGADYGYGIAVDSADHIYVTGATYSANFPTMNPYQATPGNIESAFVTELSADGQSLLYSTYLGGAAYSTAAALALGPDGTIDVAGTADGAFPTTTNAFQSMFGGGNSDAFLSVLDPSQNPTHQLTYSTYIGGAGDENGNGLAVDAHGNAYVVGSTTSTTTPQQNFPLRSAIQSTYGNGASDGFITEINTTNTGPASASLVYSTYLGGSGADAVNAVAINDLGATVTGQTTSGDFPTVNALQSSPGGGIDAFVTQINASGTALSYSTYLGGSADDYSNGVALGGRGGVFVTGLTSSSNFVTTPDAVQPTFIDPSAFVTELFPTYGGSASLLYSTFLTGSVGTGNPPPPTFGWAISADAQGNAVVVGTINPITGSTTAKDAFVGVFHASPSCPEGLDCVDIGNPGVGGDQALTGSRTDGTWTVQGTGLGIGSNYDQFHYVAQDALGDGSITARLYSQASSPTGAEMGLMYRASEDPQAPYFDIVQIPNNGGTLLAYYRTTQGGPTQLAGTVAATLPVYVRLTRTGSSFTAFTSPDPSSSSWTQVGLAIPLSAITNTVQAGLAVAAATTATTNTATFDHVEIDTCPTAWSCADIGAPALAGTQSVPGDQFVDGDVSSFKVQGAGTDIGGSGDQFHYQYTPLRGDGSVSARLSSVTTVGTLDPGTKAGVMLRASTDPAAPYYFVAVMPGDTVSVQYRATQGGTAQPLATATASTPVYVRADRSGTTFTAYLSYDQVTWTPIQGSSVGISSLRGDLLAGLAVTSHNAGALDTASFDYVRLDACPDTWSCADLGTPPVPAGTQYLSNGVWSLQGSGASQSRYVWQNVTGDSGLSARLTRQVDTTGGATAGLMYSDSTTGAFYLLGKTPTGGLFVQYRTSGSGSVTTATTYPAITLPAYMQVVRAGNQFTSFISADNATWVAIQNSGVSISMNTTAQLGLDVSAASAGTSATTFDTLIMTGTLDTTPPAGTDLWNLDTHTEHYTQGSNEQIHLQLYNSLVGIPSTSGWLQRDTTLAVTPTTGMLVPAALPFGEQIAPNTTGVTTTSTGPALAAVTSEDGTTLTVGLAVTPTVTTGQVGGSGVTFAAVEPSQATPPPSKSDLSLRATTSGLDARIVVHSVSEGGPFLLLLAANQQTQFVQDTDGTIRATQNITGYADDGVTPYTTTQTEYSVQAPLLIDSSSALTAPVTTGPATATLSSSAAGQGTVTVALDPAWLNDPHRAFPVTLDLPIVTSYSRANTGLWGTTTSCAPSMPAPQTEVVVGVLNGCTYHGQSYFDLGALPNDTTIVSATLRLYTPGQMTSTGVQVYQNAPLPDGTDPSAAPSWSNAPLVMTGTTGLAQTASDGHWQSWDVTSLVQGWVQNDATNGGVTLISSGAPVSFTSPLGAGTDSPALAPYLDITYSSTPSAHAPYYADTASSIYGVSGSFTTQAASSRTIQVASNQTCGHQVACKGDMRVSAVSGQNGGLGGALIRVGVLLTCRNGNDKPGAAYWNSYGPSPPNQPLTAGYQNGDSIKNILTEAFGSTQQTGHGVVPIVDFLIPSTKCDDFFGNPYNNGSTYNSHWTNEMADFIDTVVQPLIPAYSPSLPQFHKFMYFEIGNEQNIGPQAFFGLVNSPNGSNSNYPPIFAAAATALKTEIGKKALDPRVFGYRVLTSGMSEPTADHTSKCLNPQPDPGVYNEDVAIQSILSAEGLGMAASQLGLAAHPYNYSTNNAAYWRNYYHMYPLNVPLPYPPYVLPVYNSYHGICRDLSQMITTWTTDKRVSGQHLPLIFTEDNWNNNPEFPTDHQNIYCGDPFGCQGAYLADLFTWLYDHRTVYQTTDPAKSPLRIAWYRGCK